MFKRGQIWGSLEEWILAILVLALCFGLLALYLGKGTSAVEFLKNLVRFR